MNKHELSKLEELIKKFRSQVDADWSAQIEAAGWPDSTEVYRRANENLDSIDEIIHQVSLYKSVPTPECGPCRICHKQTRYIPGYGSGDLCLACWAELHGEEH